MKIFNKNKPITACYSGQIPKRVQNDKRKMAFTLAEVLIVLAIVGVIAALIFVPAIQKHREHAAVSDLKKFYSTMSEAFLFAKEEYGPPSGWLPANNMEGSSTGANALGDTLTKYMKIQKVCHQNQGCFPDVSYKNIDSTPISMNYNRVNFISKYRMADSKSIFFYSYSSAGKDNGYDSRCYGAMGVDINGLKGPNVLGKDLFSFVICENGIRPAGAAQTDQANFPKQCTKDCPIGGCEACTAWVVIKGNMDYLHCNDLSWTGKTKCK